MLFSGKFGAAESPSAAFIGLKRGPVALLLARFAGRRTHSGTTGALSDVSAGRRFAFFFFEPTLTRSYCCQAPGPASPAKQPRYAQVTLICWIAWPWASTDWKPTPRKSGRSKD